MARRFDRQKVFAAASVFLAASLLLPGPRTAGARDPGGRPPAIRMAQAGEVTPDKLERWQRMSPEERDRVKERYRRWKELPPERKERILERRRKWRELPEGERSYLRQRREIYRSARPEEKQVIKGFFRRWRELPPERRQALRRKFMEWRGLPAAERHERMTNEPFYRNLSPHERKVVERFLFPEPSRTPPPGHGGQPAPPGPPRE